MGGACKCSRLSLLILLCSLFLLVFQWAASVAAQQSPDTPGIPPHFNLDMETAVRLQPQLMAESVPATGRYMTGRLVFERLVREVRAPASIKLTWQLRIVNDDQLNAYSSPDGGVYVESGLAQLAGPSTGLWAAILSHEIAHVVRRDWARRYLYQKSLESGGGAVIVLGDPGIPSASWADSKKSSQDMGQFCRQLEAEADREGLMLMARAGYHPDFVPALHHLLHAQGSGAKAASLYAMHPCWEERDRELSRAYVEASIEFEHRWPEWYASPGGNPPVVVFADEPTVKKTGSKEWEIRIPMRCQNLAGAVEVVLRAESGHEKTARHERLPEPDPSRSDDTYADHPNSDHPDSPNAGSNYELRQLTGCTSPRTTITFTLPETSGRKKSGPPWTDIYILDSWGLVLARADLPKLPH